MPKPWDDPEKKLNKKLRNIGRSAAYALGGGVGLLIIKALFPKEDGNDKITGMIGDIVLILIM